MFSPSRYMAVFGCTKQRHTRLLSRRVGQAVLCGGMGFFHGM